MTEKDALAVWDSWIANEHFDANRSLPDLEMLEALLACDRPAKQGDLERLGMTNGLTVGQVASALKKRHYP